MPILDAEVNVDNPLTAQRMFIQALKLMRRRRARQWFGVRTSADDKFCFVL